jgi:hypothetical protein
MQAVLMPLVCSEEVARRHDGHFTNRSRCKSRRCSHKTVAEFRFQRVHRRLHSGEPFELRWCPLDP